MTSPWPHLDDEPLLRSWSHRDAADLLAAFGSPDLDRQGGPLHTAADATAWVERWLQAGEDGDALALAVCRAGRPVGGVALSALDRRHDTAWASYWLAPPERGRGTATRALATVARLGFEDLGLCRLELGHRVDNPASCGVARRSGFAVEGLERAKLRYGDERYDVETHARLSCDPDPGVRSLTVT